ncbi:hypothetical protein EXIGLDRAFT_730063 [Exidia glandulosa HHB12029]|uniref:Uncharacterized protein n=1 Tax=Exidia glandulosa HHB12029 TaxID=1314781 RepID=A0A165LCI4_EXIGL|nr:hypothetical protein EXIGLDRAFT_730063 [Exidia glandulosa HHB12029]
MSSPPQVVFSSDVQRLAGWAERTGLPLPGTAEALGSPYARAHRWLSSFKGTLVTKYGWRDAPQSGDSSRLLFSIGLQPTSSSGVPRAPALSLALPKHPSSFFSPERKLQWQMTFHSTAFFTMRFSQPPIQDMLYLLQCLIPGMVVVAKVEDVPGEAIYTTSRGLPPPEWVQAHQEMLVDVFGAQHYRQLFRAASTDRMTYYIETRRH